MTTNAGAPLDFLDTAWALTADGTVDRQSVTNFATRSAHESAIVDLPAATADGSRTRDLCAYPRVSRYRGHGDPAVASSYRCASR